MVACYLAWLSQPSSAAPSCSRSDARRFLSWAGSSNWREIAVVTNCFGFDAPKGFGSMLLQPLRARTSVPPAWELWRLLDELDSLLTEIASDVYCARFATE